MDTFFRDLRYAFRTLRGSPAFALAAIASLALGIGANAAIFTLLDRALLRPLPVEEPDRLVILSTLREDGERSINFSYPAYRDYVERSDAFAGLLALSPSSFATTTGGFTERVDATMVSSEYFDVLGVDVALGRTFDADEDRAPVVVLGHAYWQRRFGGEPSVVGRTITLDGHPFTVIGVAQEGFRGLWRGESAELWLPLGTRSVLWPGPPWFSSERNLVWLYVVGRLAPGLTRDQAQAAVSTLFEQFELEHRRGGRAVSLEPGGLGFNYALSDYQRPLMLLMGAVALVLLIACANVANLLLARASARRHEIRIRLSVGASRSRLVRQLLTESLLLALLGGGAGLVLSGWMADLLASFRPVMGEALAFETGPDARVLGFTLAVSLFTVLASGLVPALRASRPEVHASVKGAGVLAGAAGGRRVGLRGALVVAQIAIALVVLIGAGLLARSLANLRAVDLGFSGRNLLLVSFNLGAEYDDGAAARFQAELLRRVEAMPGVRSASFATAITPTPAISSSSGFVLEGYRPAADEYVMFDVNMVAPGYFETLGMPIVRGRGFDARDRERAPLVAVISETIAQRYWPAGDALGKWIRQGSDPGDPRMTIVGIAKAGRYRGVRETGGLMLYLPLLQRHSSHATLLVRAAVDPRSLVAAVRREIRALDPAVPVYNVRSMDEHLDRALSQDRLVTTLAGLFALLGLTLAAVGVYGVMAYYSAERAREIGIRLALGAQRRDVLRLILARAAMVLAVGLALGLAGALGLTRLAGSLLYGVSSSDAGTFAGVVLILAGVSLVASYLPARRAARGDPMIALRCE